MTPRFSAQAGIQKGGPTPENPGRIESGTAGAFVAVADGRVDSAEREEAVHYIICEPALAHVRSTVFMQFIKNTVVICLCKQALTS